MEDTKDRESLEQTKKELDEVKDALREERSVSEGLQDQVNGYEKQIGKLCLFLIF